MDAPCWAACIAMMTGTKASLSHVYYGLLVLNLRLDTILDELEKTIRHDKGARVVATASSRR